MTDEGEAGEAVRARAGMVLRHLLCAVIALVSFAVSMPQPLRLHHRHAEDLRRASIVQLDDDDDEEREVLLALVEEDDGDDEPDEPPFPDIV